MTGTILEMRDVGVRYDSVTALHDINLDIRQGEFLAVTGPNGCGKTTLLRVMLGLLKPTSGSISYFRNGEKVKCLDFGYLPQKNAIDRRFPLTVGQAVASGMLTTPWGHLPADCKERLAKVAAQCGIDGYLDRHIGALSGGQLQRTLMARALVTRPEVLVLDEPLSYVDKEFERRIYDILREVRRKMTIVVVSHEMGVFSGMADEQFTMHN